MSQRPKSTASGHSADARAWRRLVDEALARRNRDTLRRHSDDAIAIGPIYRRAEAIAPVRGRSSPGPWIVVQRADDPDSGRAREWLAADIAGGAGGIELLLAGSMSAERTGFGLNDVDRRLLAVVSDSPGLHVRLDGGEATYEYYRRIAGSRIADLILSYDPLAHAAARGGFDRPLAEIEGEIVEATREFSDSHRPGAAVVADGRIWAAAGASEAQEIAGILGSIIHEARFLVAAGLSPQEALRSIGVVADAGANQLLTIAKLRALRLCHARVAETLGAAPLPARIHAETSWRMMTRYDVHTNILRSTSAAFAAAAAGADSITVLPFTCALGLPDGFARRVARNSQTILIEESGLARVDDPAGGSGAIESLTAEIAAAAWTKFAALEASGGLLAALRRGSFQKGIADTRRARSERIALREMLITGVSGFPDLAFPEPRVVAARPPAAPGPAATAEEIPRLAAVRFAEPFEALRDRAAELANVGRAPQIFLVNLGAPADFAEAAQSATSFFAAGGIRPCVADATDSEAAADAFARSGAATACIAGSQAVLARHAAATAAALKQAGAARVYVMGGAATGEAIDAVLDETVDAVAVLSAVLAVGA